MKNNMKHLSGKLHVTGLSTFIKNKTHEYNCLYAYPIVSSVAKGKIININTDKIDKEGFDYKIIKAQDIPGKNDIAHGNGDYQPLLPDDIVTYVGQPIALIITDDREKSIILSRKIQVEYEELPAYTELDDAIAAGLEYTEARKIIRKDNKIKEVAGEISGELEVGFQEHFYFETQRCLTIPEENDYYTVYSSTQGVSEIQDVCSRILGLASNHITVDVRRLGGAFGGKEAQATLWASLTTLASSVMKKPVYLELERKDDVSWTGKRHQFKNKYKIAYSTDGQILDYSVYLRSNGGAFIDLSHAILERGLLHIDSGYYIPNLEVYGNSYRTNLPPNTAFRGFGAPQAILTTETAIERIAYKLGIDRLEIRKRNIYKKGDKAHYGMEVFDALGLEALDKLEEISNYSQLKEQVNVFNKSNKYKKQGIGIIPGKFGISFTAGFLNQGSSLVWIYSDGSISLSHGGIEMGQQLYTKIVSVVCRTLGVSSDRVRNESTNTKRIGNSSPTAASSGTDLNGNATKIACEILKDRLIDVAIDIFEEESNCQIDKDHVVFEENKVYWKKNKQISIDFPELAKIAYMKRVDLGAHGFYKTPGVGFDKEKGKGTPFFYYVFGACLIVSEIDLLTGNYVFKKIYVVHDNGNSLNRDIDEGQIYGALVQGLGYCTMEEVKYNEKGQNISSTPSTYKIPTINDIPEEFKIDYVYRDDIKASVLGSKAVGEPPFLYGLAGWLSIMNAISYLTNKPDEINLRMPATPEAVLMAIEECKGV